MWRKSHVALIFAGINEYNWDYLILVRVEMSQLNLITNVKQKQEKPEE